MSEEVIFKDSAPAAALEVASKEEAGVKSSKEVEVEVAVPHRARTCVRWLCVLVSTIVVCGVVLMYVTKHQRGLHHGPPDPISDAQPTEHSVSTHELIRRLNPDGRKIYMDDVKSGAVTVRSGTQTMVTFITTEGAEREAVLYVPDSYNATSGSSVAMMVLFHGLNDNCHNFIGATRLLPYADRDGFVVASVCGSLGILGFGWNAGTCCGFLGDTPDDVALARQVVHELSQSYAIDTERVMAVGFSNGAMLSEVLACEAPDVFRVVAAISGTTELRPGNAGGLAKCTADLQKSGSSLRSSVLMMHGTADVMVPWGGNMILGFPSVQDDLQGWTERNGCTGEPKTTISTPTYTNSLYEDCSVAGGLAVNPLRVLVNCTGAMVGGKGTVEVRIQDEARDQAAVPDTRPAFLDEEEAADGTDRKDGVEHKRGHKGLRRQREGEHKKHHDDDNAVHVVNDEVEGNGEHVTHDRGHHGKKAHNHHGYGDKHGGKGEHADGRPLHNLEHKHHGHKRHPPHSPALEHPLVVPAANDVIPRDMSGSNQVELIRVKDGAHSWPNNAEFSTTDYVYAFGLRIFGRYN